MADDLHQVLADLIDDEPCRHDHHGHCQEHDWLPDGRCRTVVARAVLARLAEGEEACGDECPRLAGERPVSCTLPKGHAVHRAATDGMAWERLCDEVAQRTEWAEAANARVRDLHAKTQFGDCVHCSKNDYPDYATPWPCATLAALDQEPK